MSFYYNPLNRACKSRTGAFARGSTVTFRVYRENGDDAEKCFFVFFQDGKEIQEMPMRRTDDGFSVNLCFNQIGLYFYYFRLDDRILECGRFRDGTVWNGSGEIRSWQITVYEEHYKTPDWMKGGVMYQIFPDRFNKAGNYPIAKYKVLRSDWGGQPNYRPNEYGKVLNNDFFGGNLNGITQKLDYLQWLGVTLIYLNPIFEAYSNHRYDTGDYMKIDPLLGTTEDLDRLTSEARKRGIRVILDAVLNHTGADSRYFNRYGRYKDSVGAYQSQSSPYYEWYRFRSYPDSYESWWGIETLPAVNETSLSYQNFIFGEEGVLKHWMRHGISGYRLDVADELPDFFLQKLRAAVRSQDRDALIIGEVWEDASNKIAYSERRQYLQGLELDSVMNYPLKDAIISYVQSGNTLQLRETIYMLIDNYPKDTLDCLMNILGTHDTARILTVLGGKSCANKDEMAVTSMSVKERDAAKNKVKMAAVLQFTLPGVPCIYYGDENGMEGYLDPFCRKCYDWVHTDDELIAFYRKLGEMRRECKAFRDGEYDEVFSDMSCMVYERRTPDEVVYVYVNNSQGEYAIELNGSYKELLTGKIFTGRLECGAHSYGILLKAE